MRPAPDEPIKSSMAAAPPDPEQRLGFADRAVVVMVAGGLWTALAVEGLSAAALLRARWLAALWLLTAPLAAVATWWLVRPGAAVAALRSQARIGILARVALAWTAVIAALTLITAIAAAPLTWDSLTYHLPRVAHWAQNESVSFYPAHIIRQLHAPPWAEYAMLHLYLVTGGDRLANLVQWGAFLGCLVGASGLARALAGGMRAQVLAAFLCATIPMGILQAASTQNDYVAALWLVCLAHALLMARRRPGGLWELAAGAALGLAWLTKGTTYVFAGPILVASLWPGETLSRRVAARTALVVVTCALVMNVPHYARNARTFGHPLGPGGEGGDYRYRNSEVSPRVLASNLIRNLALHASTPSASVNRAIESGIERFHEWIGLASDDLRSTWPGTRLTVGRPPERRRPRRKRPARVAHRRRHRRGGGRAPAGPGEPTRTARRDALGGVLLFSLLLKWSPWHARLQLPLFVLAAPLAACVLERARSTVAGGIVVVLAVTSVPYAVKNHSRPFVGNGSVLALTRDAQRAQFASVLPRSYPGAVQAIPRTCDRLGLVIGSNDPEYVIWTLLRAADRRLWIEHVLVDNASRRASRAGVPPPCALIAETYGLGAVEVGDRHYRSVWSDGTLAVLVPAARSATAGSPLGPPDGERSVPRQ